MRLATYIARLLGRLARSLDWKHPMTSISEYLGSDADSLLNHKAKVSKDKRRAKRVGKKSRKGKKRQVTSGRLGVALCMWSLCRVCSHLSGCRLEQIHPAGGGAAG